MKIQRNYINPQMERVNTLIHIMLSTWSESKCPGCNCKDCPYDKTCRAMEELRCSMHYK